MLPQRASPHSAVRRWLPGALRPPHLARMAPAALGLMSLATAAYQLGFTNREALSDAQTGQLLLVLLCAGCSLRCLQPGPHPGRGLLQGLALMAWLAAWGPLVFATDAASRDVWPTEVRGLLGPLLALGTALGALPLLRKQG